MCNSTYQNLYNFLLCDFPLGFSRGWISKFIHCLGFLSSARKNQHGNISTIFWEDSVEINLYNPLFLVRACFSLHSTRYFLRKHNIRTRNPYFICLTLHNISCLVCPGHWIQHRVYKFFGKKNSKFNMNVFFGIRKVVT